MSSARGLAGPGQWLSVLSSPLGFAVVASIELSVLVRRLGDIIPYVTDAIDHDGLYRLAESQAGYFTAGQAIAAGMDRSTLRHHARPGGRYERVRRGLYRLRHFPSSPNEHVVAAWLGVRGAHAVVSHESALELYELSDVIPTVIHISLPRMKRGQRPRTGVRFHTLKRPPAPSEVRNVHGIPVTTPERSIVDSLDAGTQPEQIELAIRQALERGLTTPRRLREVAEGRSSRVRRIIERALGAVPR
jgi:predicted transcriptional regulator of viral defense system